MKRLIALFVLLVAGGVESAMAQDRPMPPGKWWRRPEVTRKLQLSPDQQNRLDAIARDSARTLIDLKAEVEKREMDVRDELEAPKLDRLAIQKSANALSQARGRLFERELMMMVDMRDVLRSEQWEQLRSAMAQRPNRNPMPGQPGQPGQQRRRQR